MKHILNDISQEEKNRILEQHSGGKTIDTTKFKRLLESTMGNVKPLVSEQMENEVDPQDLNSHFQFIEKKLTPRGYKKDESMLKNMGTITLSKEGEGGIDQNGVSVMFVNPAHPYSKKAGYVIRVTSSKNGNPIHKDWKSNPDLQEVLKLVQDYDNYVFGKPKTVTVN
jgi:hypothetical protein